MKHAVTLGHLEALCRSGTLPYLRSHRGTVYTVAIHRHGMLAVAGRLTSNTEGPPPVMRRVTWTRGRRVNLAEFREFIETTRKVASDGLWRGEPVEVNGQLLDARLARRFLLPQLGAKRVTLRAGQGGVVRLDGDGWILLIAGMRTGSFAPRATWGQP